MYQISRLVIARETIYIYACICTTQISRLVIARETISIRVYIYVCTNHGSLPQASNLKMIATLDIFVKRSC